MIYMKIHILFDSFFWADQIKKSKIKNVSLQSNNDTISSFWHANTGHSAVCAGISSSKASEWMNGWMDKVFL